MKGTNCGCSAEAVSGHRPLIPMSIPKFRHCRDARWTALLSPTEIWTIGVRRHRPHVVAAGVDNLDAIYIARGALKCAKALSDRLAGKIRRNWVFRLYFAIPDLGRSHAEAEWTPGRSVTGRTKLRYGRNYCGRSAYEMEPLASSSGCTDVAVRSPTGSITIPADDDISQQNWPTAPRR